MTNVSARFWVVQIDSEDTVPEVESLASAVYLNAIKIPYMAHFSISTSSIDKSPTGKYRRLNIFFDRLDLAISLGYTLRLTKLLIEI